MAKKEKEQENLQENSVESQVKTKKVRNRGNGKIELFVNNEVVVILPKTTVEVPYDLDIPLGIGLYVV